MLSDLSLVTVLRSHVRPYAAVRGAGCCSATPLVFSRRLMRSNLTLNGLFSIE